MVFCNTILWHRQCNWYCVINVTILFVTRSLIEIIYMFTWDVNKNWDVKWWNGAWRIISTPKLLHEARKLKRLSFLFENAVRYFARRKFTSQDLWRLSDKNKACFVENIFDQERLSKIYRAVFEAKTVEILLFFARLLLIAPKVIGGFPLLSFLLNSTYNLSPICFQRFIFYTAC